MKKRIIAFGVALTVLFCSLGFAKRASAAATGTIVAIASIGSLAFSVFMLITSGEAEKIADDVYNWIEYTAKPGAEELFVGDGSDLAVGYNQIFQTIKGWFDSGELEIVDGKVKLTYAQYRELYGQVLNVMSRPSVEFQSSYNCTFYEMSLPDSLDLPSLPISSEYVYTDRGQSFTAIAYDDNRIVFAPYYFTVRCLNDNFTYPSFSSFYLDTDYSDNGMFQSFSGASDCTISKLASLFMPLISFLGIHNISYSYYIANTPYEQSKEFDYCFVYENGIVNYKPITDVDVSGLSTGLVTTTGDYRAFLQSLKGFTSSLTQPNDLDDLSGTIPDGASLTFPVNPDSSVPLNKQVTVGDVPGMADAPLSDYQADFDTDIDIPSIIVDKFPFCIPFDFIRFLGVLCAEPQAPVFRIPISTHPDNLEQWEGNQTVGEYLNPDNPMFEIDEEIVIDLSVIPLVQPICYTCFIVGFIFLLLHITPKMIQH